MQSESACAKYILAYDADCGPCTRFRNAVDFLDRYERIDFISLVKADKNALLVNIPTDLRYKSFHLILPNGNIKSGAEGLLELIRILPAGRIVYPVINYFPGGKHIVRFVYRRLSKLHDGASCAINNNRKTLD
jgi:predicted DCC family thiol-disulfide oxidoreductase YuxK